MLATAIGIHEARFGSDRWFTAEARLAQCEALEDANHPDATNPPCSEINEVLMTLFGETDSRFQRARALTVNQ